MAADRTDASIRPPLPDPALDVLFRTARTQNKWRPIPVDDATLRALYELLKWGPTSGNSTPTHFVFCRSEAAKARIARHAGEKNASKILSAPVTVIVASDPTYYEALPRLFPLPHVPQMVEMHRTVPGLAATTAFRNSSLQGAYLILAARALGLDCGPMSGFSNAGVDGDFFTGTPYTSNFLCSLGYGDPTGVFPRLPRRPFDEACELL